MPTRQCPGCEETKCYGAEYRFCPVCDPEGETLAEESAPPAVAVEGSE